MATVLQPPTNDSFDNFEWVVRRHQTEQTPSQQLAELIGAHENWHREFKARRAAHRAEMRRRAARLLAELTAAPKPLTPEQEALRKALADEATVPPALIMQREVPRTSRSREFDAGGFTFGNPSGSPVPANQSLAPVSTPASSLAGTPSQSMAAGSTPQYIPPAAAGGGSGSGGGAPPSWRLSTFIPWRRNPKPAAKGNQVKNLGAIRKVASKVAGAMPRGRVGLAIVLILVILLLGLLLIPVETQFGMMTRWQLAKKAASGGVTVA